MTPVREAFFRCLGRAWVAQVFAPDAEFGTQDVVVYELKGAGFRWQGVGVLGSRLLAGPGLDRALTRAVTQALEAP